MALMHYRPPFTRLVQALPAMVPFVAPEAHERRMGCPLKLRLGANESVLGISPLARQAMLEAMDRVTWYGDPESYELRAELARIHNLAIVNLIVGSGIDDLLCLIARTFIDANETVVTSLGAYPTFNYFVASCGGKIHCVPYRDFRNDLQSLANMAARVGARIVYLTNPDNPTGTWQTAVDIQNFIERLPPYCLLVLDEAYADFASSEAVPPLDADDPRVIRLRTFSKAHGMAGARIGYAIAAAETIATFNKIRIHFGVNRIAQAGALASLYDPTFVLDVVGAVAKGRQEYEALAQELGFTALPSATNFVSIDVGGPERARAMVAALLERGVFVRMPNASPLDRCIRVTVGTPAQRMAFADILREVRSRF